MPQAFDDFLDFLRCPLTGSKLSLAPRSLINLMNERIKRNQLEDRSGVRVTRTIDRGLVNTDQHWLFPIRGNIPQLTATEAISIKESDE